MHIITRGASPISSPPKRRAPQSRSRPGSVCPHMDKRGIRQALLMPGAAHGETGNQNDYVAHYRELHPDRFPAAVGTVNPFDGDKAVAEVYRCVRTLGF